MTDSPLHDPRPAAAAQAPDSPVAEDGDDRIIGQAFRASLWVILAVGGVVGGLVLILNRPVEPEVKPVAAAAPPKKRTTTGVAKVPQVMFTDITAAAGVKFVHVNGATGEKLLPETMGGGCAWFDYDNDDDQDLLLVNSNRWPWSEPPADAPPATSVLYRNDGFSPDGGLRLSDVSVEAGIAVACYGMGVAVGDYDNDGWVDVFLSAVGGNRLLKNVAGKFSDVTGEAGVAGDGGWSTATGFIDIDHDGDLDLVVCNYVKWSREIDKAQDFRLVGVGRAYGPPLYFEGTFPYLYRNDGAGKFVEVAAESGLHVRNPNTKVPMAKSLGLAPVDLDSDGWIDLLVANDTVQNFVFHNQKNGKFKEIGALTGMAFDTNGNARGAMGIDVGAFRNNGSLGVLIGNFSNEMASLFVSQNSPLQFADEATATGLGPPSRLQLKFGVFFVDYDLDGRLDALTANGHLEEEINKVQSSQQYAQSPQLFWNCGSGESTEFRAAAASECGPDFVRPLVGRGAAYADIDADGDLDLLITAVGGPPRLLRNDQDLKHHWVRFRLTGNGSSSNRDAIGAWVDLTADGVTQRRQVMPTRSYLSQSELPVTFGLGGASKIERVIVRWPDGTNQELSDVKINAVNKVVQPAK